jgi:hypothetical protein
MIKRLTVCVALVLAPPISRAHVGSPNVFYEGLAGTYHVKVIVRPPNVVPGLAEISVRVLNGNAQRVTVLPVRWDAGKKGAPPPDEAAPVRGESNLFNAQLWIMTSGAYSIFVDVEGAQGSGTTIVPLNSVAMTRLAMPPLLGSAFLAMGAFLFVALVSIVGAAARESILSPGVQPDRRRIWRARLAMAVAFLVLTSGLYGGQKWWNAVDSDYRNNKIFRPDPINASIREVGPHRVLRLEREEQRWGRRPLIPDHGKLMHLFLISEPGMNAFAHLHPVPSGSNSFETLLPLLPSGDYHLYADITHESGFTQTLTSKVHLAASVVSPPTTDRSLDPDPDDSWHIGPDLAASLASGKPISSLSKEQTAALEDGFTMTWVEPQRILPNNELALQFRVVDANGQAAKLEPYLGMQAHAAIQRADGGVFTHLHPFGTISMASQQLFVKRERDVAPDRKTLEIVCGLPPSGDVISFPYEFPKAGQYRIWVQVKVKGRIMTGVFDAEVAEQRAQLKEG